MKKNSLILAVLGITAAVFMAGCGSVNKKSAVHDYTRIDLIKHARGVLTEEEFSRFQVPYQINDELRKAALSVIDRRLSDVDNAKKIALLLLREDGEGFGISYSRNTNLCALDVFAERKANCISYTNLFVGMARSVGIDANYAEVTEVESFSKVGGTVVYNSHVAAVVFAGPNPYIIDFSLRRYPQYHSWRTITDVEAVASFYNNIGSSHFLAGNTPENLKEAEFYFTMAMKLKPDFAQAYNNLGVLRMKELETQAAMDLYRKALEVKPGYFAPYNNLSSIYMSNGEYDRAIDLMNEAIKASPDNYFAYVSLSRLYVFQKRLVEAEETLKQALAINKKYTEARHELGRLYLKLGRSEEARQQFALALKYQPDDDVALTKMDLIERLSAASTVSDKLP